MAGKRPPNRVETLPSGIEVAYWDAVGLDGAPQQRRYRVSVVPEVSAVDGERLPSVSTIAGVFDKFALVPAAVKLQEEGVIALAKDGFDIGSMSPEELRAAMVAQGLHYDSKWGKARERGDAAHEMLMELVRDGKVPNLSNYPPDLRPWIAAGMKWFLDAKPEVIDVEYMVASTEHGFAGRSDLYCRLRDGRTARVDYKTVTEWKCRKNSKGEPTDKLYPPYDENLIALAGYELAAPESGYEESDCRLIVRLGPDGEYDVTESHATEDVFLAALTAYNEKKWLTTGRPKVTA